MEKYKVGDVVRIVTHVTLPVAGKLAMVTMYDGYGVQVTGVRVEGEINIRPEAELYLNTIQIETVDSKTAAHFIACQALGVSQ